ncbi:hypothetical protein Hdeb2414_s0011g00371921 [Helianthus debilis subsp. tardiflorus]
MSSGEHHGDLSEEMSAEVPPLKWPRASLDGLVQNLRFPENCGALYPEEGQTTTDAPAGYINLFWDFFCEGNFHLPVTKFFLEILGYYKFHISQCTLSAWLGFDILSLYVRQCILSRRFLDLGFFTKCTVLKDFICSFRERPRRKFCCNLPSPSMIGSRNFSLSKPVLLR